PTARSSYLTGEARHDVPGRDRLARRIHEALVQAEASLAVDRREVGLPPLGGGKNEMSEAGRRGHVDVLTDDEHPALLERLDDAGDALPDRAAFRAIQHGLHDPAALLERGFHRLGVEGRQD